MYDEDIIIQHRFSDQLMCVPLSQYRAGVCGRYCDWQLRGRAAFIAPPPLNCLPPQGPPPPPSPLLPATPIADDDSDGDAMALADYMAEELTADMPPDLDYDTDTDEALALAHHLQGEDYDNSLY